MRNRFLKLASACAVIATCCMGLLLSVNAQVGGPSSTLLEKETLLTDIYEKKLGDVMVDGNLESMEPGGIPNPTEPITPEDIKIMANQLTVTGLEGNLAGASSTSYGESVPGV